MKNKGNAPLFGLGADLFRMTGTDLTPIDGINVMTATTILSEAGWDMSKWKTEDHFVSWLRLYPDNRISVALKMAASTLRLSSTYVGAQFRRLRTKLGAPVAIKAMAAKLARLVYRMLRYGMKYVDQGAEFYEAQHCKPTDQPSQMESCQAGIGIASGTIIRGWHPRNMVPTSLAAQPIRSRMTHWRTAWPVRIFSKY